MRNRITQPLLFAVAILLALNLYVTSSSRTVSAQTGSWKVMTFSPGERGAAKLEAELNTGAWSLHTLHVSNIQGQEAIAVLEARRSRTQ